MSVEARQALVDDSRLHINATQRADLLDTNKTNTWLIELLSVLIRTAGHPILVTAIYTDHHTGTLHHPTDGSPGRAVDCWHADWETVGDDKIVDVMRAAAKIGNAKSPFLVEVGLSGDAARLQNEVEWGSITNVFVEDWGDGNEHLHLGVGVPT